MKDYLITYRYLYKASELTYEYNDDLDDTITDIEDKEEILEHSERLIEVTEDFKKGYIEALEKHPAVIDVWSVEVR